MTRIRHVSPFDRTISVILLVVMVMGCVLSAPSASTSAKSPIQPRSLEKATGDGANGGSSDPDLAKPATSRLAPKLANSTGPTKVMIQLTDETAIDSYVKEQSRSGLSSNAAISASRAQVNRLETAQQQLLNTASSAGIKTEVIYRVQRVYNGIAATVDGSQLAALARLPGVKSVQALPQDTINNASSVPFIGAPQAWGYSTPITGTGVKIAIIDSGIDYIHTDFGGPGTGYATNNTTGLTNTIFPTPKVVGGYDFSGDNYDANVSGSLPAPDPNPMDCNGHGSHVSGTAAGLGVNTDGTTYTGAYNTSTNFSNFRIGPGVAPGAQLYGYRVFGCTGSTNLVIQAIEKAIDPNGDANYSDRADVINMSLGSDFGSGNDLDAQASNNASLVGTMVAVAAGNANDIYYILGSPGSATRAVTVAASQDPGNVVDGFRVNGGTPNISGVYSATFSANYPWQNPSAPVTTPVPVTATVYYPSSTLVGTIPANAGCGAFPAADASNISGKIVLLDWVPTGFTTFPCGSAVRVNNAQAAGAKGVIIVDSVNTFSTSIAGNATTPAVFAPKVVGDKLKTQLVQGVSASLYTVTLDPIYASSIHFEDPSANDVVASFTSRGPAPGTNNLKPDIDAPGFTIFSALALSGNKGESLNGTSMATPHIAGVLALLKQEHPTWTVEELKSLAMNTAGNSVYSDTTKTTKESPSRVGAGRVDVAKAITDTVIAYNGDGSGEVSLAYGLTEAVNTTTFTKTLTVVNKGGTGNKSYTLGYSPTYNVPGVSVLFPGGNTVNLNGGTPSLVTVVLQVNPSQLVNTVDPSLQTTQLGLPRSWLTEATGLVTLTPTAGTDSALRVPLHAIVRPATQITDIPAGGGLNPSGAVYTTTLNPSGNGYNQGTGANSEVSFVTAVEWQGSEPMTTSTDPAVLGANIQHYGVNSNYMAQQGVITNTIVDFGISNWGNINHFGAEQAEFDIHVSLNITGTFSDDYVIYNSRYQTTANKTDAFVTYVVKTSNNSQRPDNFINFFTGADLDTAVFNNSVMAMPVDASYIGLSGGQTKFRYYINSFNSGTGALINQTATQTYDVANPGFTFDGGNNGNLFNDGTPAFFDDASAPITTVIYSNGVTSNQSKGILLLHHFNQTGARAQTLCTSDTAITRTDDGTDCGTLRHASIYAPSGASLTASGTITLTQPITFGRNLTLTGPTCASPLVLNGQGVTGSALLVNGPVNLINVTVKGSSSGPTIKTLTGAHLVPKCVKATK